VTFPALSDKNRLRRYATTASISIAVILVAVKTGAWIATDSVAMLSSLLDSAIDCGASLVTAYGVSQAMQPPDRDHRYGHGKAEPLAALAQAAIIIGSSFMLGWQAIDRLYHPRDIENPTVGYAAMALAVVMTGGLVIFQNHVVKQTASAAIGADRIHYIGDLAINLAVIAAFILHGLTDATWLDPAFAFAIATGMLVSAARIMKTSLNTLMDTELPEQERLRILEIIKRQPGVLGAHDMRTRSDGEYIFIDVHVEMDGEIKLRAAHDLAEAIINSVKAEIPNSDILIHQDPSGIEEDRRDTRIEHQTTHE
jgi:ferrous-iron efflux pump FieF